MSRVIYITVKTPLGSSEEFIIPEMVELVRCKQDLLIVPRSPSGPKIQHADAQELQPFCVCQPLLSWVILRAAIQELAKNYIKCLRLILRILVRSGTVLHLLKNLTVFPKALWLARLAREWGADHLHAHWSQSTATMAMIAGEITGIPWSFTAHRGDIVEDNMFEAKLQSATFVRFISRSGVSLAQAIIKGKLPDKCHVIHMGVEIA
jgi:colanic acid/amylovoran biosynthesis glycosyltransferase